MELLGLIGIGFFLAVTAGGIIGLVNASLPARVRDLRAEIAGLKERVERLEGGIAAASAEAPRTTVEPESVAEEETVEAPVPPQAPPEAAKVGAKESAPADAKPRRSSLLRRAEGRFASYWTGILGVLALVAGFSFLAVLTALRMGAFARFLMVSGIALLFWIGSRVAARRGRSELFPAWFRSAAGALFLFACAGSASVPWLRWVDNAPQGYALLAAGLLVNLLFALTGPYQLFASFHTLISLTALAAAPQNPTVLIAAAVVAGVGSIPSLRRPWGLHLLLSELFFFAFVAAWVFRQTAPTAGIDAAALLALLAGLAPALIAPYVSEPGKTPGLTLSARGAAWLFLFLGTVNMGVAFTPVSLIFAALALAAYLPGRLASSAGEPVRRIDTAAGLLLASSAALGLVRLELDLFAALVAASLIALLAAVDLRRRRMNALFALSLASLFALLLSAAALFRVLPGPDLPLLTGFDATAGLILLAVSAVAVLSMLASSLFAEDPKLRIPLAAAFGFLGLGILILGPEAGRLPLWIGASGSLLLPFVAVAVLIPRRRPAPFLGAAAVLLAAGAHLLALLSASGLGELGRGGELAAAGLLLPQALLMVAAGFGPRGRGRISPVWPGVLLAVADTAILGAIAVQGADPWAPLSVWALISAALYLLISLRPAVRRDLRDSSIAAGTGLLLFAAAAALLLLATDEFEGPRLLRLASLALTAFTLLLWARPDRDDQGRSRRWVLLIAIVFIVSAAALESGGDGFALATLICAVAALLAGRFGPRFLGPLLHFSIPILWLGLLFLPLAAIDYESMRVATFSSDWWLALLSGAAAVLYLAVAYGLGLFRLQEGNEGDAGRWERLLDGNLHRVLFLPLFLSLGIFFWLSAAGPVLTSLYILMSFALFTLGIVLREASFRPFAYALLLVSLVRLVVADMAEADTLERALVFIIAGAVLLGMNWIYNRFSTGEEERGEPSGD